jgi:molecular chaperone Hsp33
MTDKLIDIEDVRLRRHDHIVRGVAADGMVRAFAIAARETVQTACERHHASPVVTAALGRLMMGAQMMGVMLKGPDELITLTVRGDGPLGGLTVTADTHGHVKGFANHPNVWLPLNGLKKLDVGGAVGAGTFTVVRDQPGIDPYVSQVELVSGEIGDDLASYFLLSDQVPTSVGVGVLVDRDLSVAQAGGFIIQLMPGHYDYLVDDLESSLDGINSVTQMMQEGWGPSDILRHLLRGMDYKELEAIPASFRCGCNYNRAARVMMALGADELRDMVAKGETGEAHCHFCGNRFTFSPQQLAELLGEAGAR